MLARRHSPKREKILKLLQHHHGALTVSELHKHVPEMNITTIYRNLELFVKDGLVKKINLGSDEAHYEYSKEPHHHAICTDCDKVIHFQVSDEKIKKLLDLPDFNAESVEITVHGTCRH